MKNSRWFLVILLLFALSRFLGADQVYHQDEYRWIMQADPHYDDVSPHPPLTKYYFRMAGLVLGFEHMRWAVLLFSVGNLILLYLVSLKLTKNRNIALAASALFSLNVYSIIASLQIDIDGAVLPFFVLLGFLSYLNLLEKEKSKKLWWFLMAVSIVGGFFSKLSFALFIGTMVLDYCLRLYRDGVGAWKIIKYIFLRLIAPIAFLGFIFYFFYSNESGGVIIDYARHFNSLNFGSRAYADLAFKIIKSLIWLSPFLTLPVLWGLFDPAFIKRYAFLYLYLAVNLIFYLVLFDFAKLTLERYFMFLVVPAVIISAEVIYNLLKGIDIRKNYFEIVAVLILFAAFSLSILTAYHDVVPLNPKIEYVNHLKSLNLNFLIPTTGGSGPIGFYVSAQFIFWSWVLCTACLLAQKKRLLVYIFLIFGLGYNIVLSGEYLAGNSYGSVDRVAKESLEYVIDNNEIKDVITYYDTGAYYLRINNKYSARFYTAPSRDYRERMNAFRGHYMIVDFPVIDKKSEYWQLISRCALDKKITDKYVDSYIFDCRSLAVKL